jgi:NAD(P)H-flavin reductase/ferredoxin
MKINVAVEKGGAFEGRPGETLLDAALRNGVEIPHDCRSGHCGTCRCDLVSGTLVGGHADAGAVLACQARLIGDVTIAIEDTPPIETFSGRVRSLEWISSDVAEATIDTRAPLDYLPGQYCQFRFAGFPGRCYSPTQPLTGPTDRSSIRLHIRQTPKGRVSGALGKQIKPGHKVKIDGPFGAAFLRKGKTQRLVLVASGTGFAPVWSIALAALSEMPDREIVVLSSARTRDAFYMAPALKRLLAFPNVSVVPVLRYGGASGGMVRTGAEIDHLPELMPGDIVYAAGAEKMVEAVTVAARAAGATCYADPFAPAQADQSEMPAFLAKASRAVSRLFLAAGKEAA